jgi:hypothetical protein
MTYCDQELPVGALVLIVSVLVQPVDSVAVGRKNVCAGPLLDGPDVLAALTFRLKKSRFCIIINVSNSVLARTDHKGTVQIA